mmetsp:Transcript_70378/g.132833  ORF Transcript_70378/g.132833 Transcript_70378/m.132833 type:complete len:425 (-) Transcript_70378:90-1364(-)
MSPAFLAAAFLFLLFVALPPAAHAATQSNRHRQLRQRLTSGAASSTHLSKRSRNVKVTNGEGEDDQDDDDDDGSGDDTEDADDRQEEAWEEKEEALNLAAQEKRRDDDRKAAEAELQLAVKTKQEALAGTVLQLTELQAKKAHIENKSASDQEIDASIKVVANETESKGLAAMLGSMWKDMRMYEAPSYVLYLGEQIKKLQKQKKVQEQELSSAEAALAAKQSEWAKIDATPVTLATTTTTAAPATTTLAVVLKDPKPWKPWWMDRKLESLAGGLVYLVFGVVCAYIYSRMRYRKDFFPAQGLQPQEGRWTTPWWGCLRSMRMCLAGFCCPCLRWADTVDRAKLGMSFWPAFMVTFILMTLDMYIYGIASLVIVFLGVRFRQAMRYKYNLPYGTRKSYLEDFALWCCCTPCAIVQEASEELAQR